MNNLAIAVLLGACAPILCMDSGILIKEQPVAAMRTATITIRNETPDSIEVLVRYSNRDELVRLCIDPKDKVSIPEAQFIETLYALRYGRYLKWTNLSQLTLGLVTPYNIISEPLLCHFISNNASATVTIKRGNKIVEALTDDNRLRWAAGLLSPYVHEVSCANEQDRSDQDLFWTFFSYFPRVQRAVNEGQPILPRYFLNLPENANAYAIWSAYERVTDFWEQCKAEKTDSERIRLADQALSFIKAAWKSLSRGGEYTTAFNALVAAEADAPTVYGKTEWTEEKRASWLEMGGTFESSYHSAPDADNSQNDNNNNGNIN